MLRQIRPDPLLDIRELIIQTESSVPVHLEGVRDPSIIMIFRHYCAPWFSIAFRRLDCDASRWTLMVP